MTISPQHGVQFTKRTTRRSNWQEDWGTDRHESLKHVRRTGESSGTQRAILYLQQWVGQVVGTGFPNQMHFYNSRHYN